MGFSELKKNKTISEAYEYLIDSIDLDAESSKRLAFMVIEDLFGITDMNNMRLLLDEEEKKIIEVCHRLNAGEPLQYVTGIAHFYGLIFRVNASVLIPRPETEELVYEVINKLKTDERTNLKILDIGTGSGCIALTIKNIFPECQVFALDKSYNALMLAKENMELLRLSVELIQDDITQINSTYLRDAFFHYIISNPPYIQESERVLMQRTVLEYEPREALFPENQDPIRMYRSILDYAMDHLMPGGWVFLELNEFLADRIEQEALHAGLINTQVKLDMQGKKRMLLAMKSMN